MISKMLGEKEMPTPLLLVCAILCCGLQVCVLYYFDCIRFIYVLWITGLCIVLL